MEQKNRNVDDCEGVARKSAEFNEIQRVVNLKDQLTEERLELIKNDMAKLDWFISDCRRYLAYQRSQDNWDWDECSRVARLEVVAGWYYRQMDNTLDVETTLGERVADIEYSIKASEMKYTYDVKCFSRRVKALFEWHTNMKEKKVMMAPYFPFIQSSGMGKTKLLYEYKKSLAGQNIDCILLICLESESHWAQRTRKGGTIYDFFFHARQEGLCTEEQYKKEMKSINGALDNILECEDLEQEKVVILFDEAQFLLTRDAFSFCCIRRWLRKIVHAKGKKPVAVFTGTTSQLANFYKENTLTNFSRDGTDYHKEGNNLYEPFFELCTSGILAGTLDTDGSKNDLRSALKFGRPLFGVQKWEEIEENMAAVGNRMLINRESGVEWNRESCFSILGTRVQMGQTNFKLASNLVSHGYASLTNFKTSQADVAHIAFLPDPLCARIAMVFMREKSEETSDLRVTGKAPRFWTSKADELFSGGLCFPPKGDVGEVAGALYMLFCGDELRQQIDPKMYTFRVPVLDWIERLSNPNSELNDKNMSANTDAEISFIQVCRNHLRHPTLFLTSSEMHKNWFEAGLAFYAHSQCFAYDLIAPIRFPGTDGLNPMFVPMLVQIKNWVEFSDDDFKNSEEKLRACFNKAEIKRGLGIVLAVGLDESPSMNNLENVENVKTWCDVVRGQISSGHRGGILILCVRVPKDDPFGINSFARNVSSSGGHRSEVYESHFELRDIAKETIDEKSAEKCLRNETDSEGKDLFCNFLKENKTM